MMRRSSSPARTPAILTGLLALVACVGGSQTKPAPQPKTAQPAAPQAPVQSEAAPAASAVPSGPAPVDWLVVDSASRTATMSLEVTRSLRAPSALLNGYRAGEARVIVPVGWTIKWNWRNSDATSPHSLVVMIQREKIPLEGGRSAFMNALTRMLTGGLPQGQTDQTTFQADEAGWFWIMCGVPEHGLNGEWLELRVDPEASSARVEIRKR